MPILRRVLQCIVALGLAAPAEAQRPARADDFLGVTRCDSGQAVTEIRQDVLTSVLREEVEAHEEVHRRQAVAYGGCVAFLASLTTARHIIESELPAYCAQWRVAVRRGADSAATRLEYAWRIAAQSGAMENRLDIARRFRQECG